MESIITNERSLLTEKYLADLKIRIGKDGLGEAERRKNYSNEINDLEWYMRARKYFESGESDKFLDEISGETGKYEEMMKLYGSVSADEPPKFSTRELELYIQDVKVLESTLFPSSNSI